MEDGSWVVEKSNIELGATMPDRIELAKPIDECYKKLTTIDKWKRDLLDLTARNYLIKMKLGKRFLPLLVPDINLFEEGLYGGKNTSWSLSRSNGAELMIIIGYLLKHRDISVMENFCWMALRKVIYIHRQRKRDGGNAPFHFSLCNTKSGGERL